MSLTILTADAFVDIASEQLLQLLVLFLLLSCGLLVLLEALFDDSLKDLIIVQHRRTQPKRRVGAAKLSWITEEARPAVDEDRVPATL